MEPDLLKIAADLEAAAQKIREAHKLTSDPKVAAILSAVYGRSSVVPPPPPPTPSAPQPTNGSHADEAFAKLTKAQAVEKLLREVGNLKAAELFTEMKKRGHAVSNVAALGTMLSTNKDRFKFTLGGKWTLVQAQMPVREGTK